MTQAYRRNMEKVTKSKNDVNIFNIQTPAVIVISIWQRHCVSAITTMNGILFLRIANFDASAGALYVIA